jgi:3-methyladenine DNA glycosylase/8-oxoguanine DNA glycosylase
MSTLSLAVPRGFSLHHAVCSYGYFLLAPNRWDPQRRVLHRAFHMDPADAEAGVVWVTVSQPARRRGALRVVCDRRLDRAAQARVKAGLSRMLRVDEDQRGWWRVHPEAKAARFGRMFHSPSLWEDLVKTITGCNVTWRNTITMNRLLCETLGGGAFPTPGQVTRCGETRLKRRCKVGYRAGRIVQLARDVRDGRLDAAWFEDPSRTTDELKDALLELPGVGPYAAANMLQLLGHHDHVPIDTETYRHFEQVHGIDRPAPGDSAGYRRHDAMIREHYRRYTPHAFKAYWFELWTDYQRRAGPAWAWDRERDAGQFTAAVLNS